jgi:O-antigen/teichoic acid export membrane protein
MPRLHLLNLLRLLSRSSLLMGSRLVGAGAGFLSQVLLARLLPADDLGVIFLLTSLALILGTVAAVGYSSMANRFLVRYERRGRLHWRAMFLQAARRDIALSAFLLTAVVVLLAACLPSLSAEARYATALAGLAIPAFAFMRLNGGIANSARRFNLSFLPDNFVRPCLLVALLGIASLAGLSLDAAEVAALFSGVALLTAAAQAVVLGKLPGPTRIKRDARLIRRWRRAGPPLVIVALFTTLFGDLVILLSGLILPSADLAVFGICLKVTLLAGFTIHVIHQLATPDLTEAHAGRALKRLDGAVQRANALAVGLMIAASIVLAAAGPAVLSLFGPHYAAGASVLMVLMAAQIVRAAGGPALPLLIASGGQAKVLPVFAFTLVVFAACLASLVPLFGITGAALAYFIATLVSTAGLAVAVWRHAGVRSDACASFARVRSAKAPLPAELPEIS